jgi:hypothetical protein
MLKWLIALTSVFSTAAVAATAWTWVDEQGQRHYSDRPVPGATQIELPDSQAVSGARARSAEPAQTPQLAQTPDEEQAADAATSYTVFDIVSPENGATLWNIGATLTLQLAIYPELQAGHRIDAIVDGRQVEIGSRSLSLTIPDVFRGEHQVQAVIVDAEGNELRRSPLLTLQVQQTSLLNPNNPNNATNPGRAQQIAPRN